MVASEIRALFAVASRPEIVSLAGGSPFVSVLPLNAVGDMVGRLIASFYVTAGFPQHPSRRRPEQRSPHAAGLDLGACWNGGGARVLTVGSANRCPRRDHWPAIAEISSQA
jgi:hypothetical protein